jgi:tyramine---L-glutamate ligase
LRIFVYEFITGGGLLGSPAAPSASLLAEGRAMVQALVADFSAIDGAHVTTLCDPRSGARFPHGVEVISVDHPAADAIAFDRQAAAADWTVVIAPEFDGHLLDRCRRVLAAGGRLLGPGPRLVELASDKHATAEHLRSAGVPVPFGIALAPHEPPPIDFPWPAILKPRFGAGSQDVRLINRPATLPVPARLEEFCPGHAASVAILCGPEQTIPLPACRQHLSDDCQFRYLGGSLPLPIPLANRARRLALQAANTLPDRLGYLGIDLVLGESSDGHDGRVIEVNPRLTTSYVGLRAATRDNLSAAMLALARGESPALAFEEKAIEFLAAGTVRTRHPAG